VTDGDRIRLFCALRLPGEAVDRIAVWSAQALGTVAGRLVPPHGLHLTLAFLGPRPAGELSAIAGELRAAAAGAGPLAFEVRGYRETRSVGMIAFDDLDGAGAALAADLGERLERLGGYRREGRPWLPHVTVLRFRDRPRLDPPAPDLGRVTPSDAAVYSSVLRPTGAHYEVLETAALGGR
jgi:2'-5' RNA ligase